MRAAGSAAAGPAGAKAAPQPKITNQQPSDDDLHEEYAWAWVLHNLVPFADKLLGIAGRACNRYTPSTRCWPHDCVCSIWVIRTGAMDQRPLSWYDWPLRLPFILWAAARPIVPDGADGRPRHECHLLGRAHAGRLGLHVLGRADGADVYRGGALGEQRNSY